MATSRVLRVPKVQPRRPYIDDEPDGYQESDRDFCENNMDACVWFLENRDRIVAQLKTKQSKNPA